MKFEPSRLRWTREPERCMVREDRIELTTQPGTDLWQRTYYHFRNDSAPVLQLETEERFFSFTVRTGFADAHQRFDQCGIVMYLDSENWLKASVEYENEDFQHLGSVVTNHGYSDWATTAIPAQVKTITASNAPRTGNSLHSCGYAICGRARAKSPSACTRAVRRTPPSRRFSPTWR